MSDPSAETKAMQTPAVATVTGTDYYLSGRHQFISVVYDALAGAFGLATVLLLVAFVLGGAATVSPPLQILAAIATVMMATATTYATIAVFQLTKRKPLQSWQNAVIASRIAIIPGIGWTLFAVFQPTIPPVFAWLGIVLPIGFLLLLNHVRSAIDQLVSVATAIPPVTRRIPWWGYLLIIAAVIVGKFLTDLARQSLFF